MVWGFCYLPLALTSDEAAYRCCSLAHLLKEHAQVNGLAFLLYALCTQVMGVHRIPARSLLID